MPTITALLHTKDDALRLGRALETLRPCDEILVVDHGSRDNTILIARQYGAHIISAQPGFLPTQYLPFAKHPWILCLEPNESLTEGLEASLFEWISEAPIVEGRAFSAFLREETVTGWVDHPTPQTRLVPQSWPRWHDALPAYEPAAIALEGELLRFQLP